MPDKTRLLLFTNTVAVGGMEEHVELLARHLNRDQFEVFAVCPKWPATEKFSRDLASAADHFAEITPDNRYGRKSQVQELLKFYRQLRAWRIQTLHMHSTTYRGQTWAFVAARLAGVKRILVTEHLAPDAPVAQPQRLIRDTFTRFTDRIVCVSQKNYVARATYLYTPPDKTTVVNNGVDLDDFQPIAGETLAKLRTDYNLPANTKIVGTVVRFEPEKGLEYLIKAAPAILKACPDTIFLMVGDGSLRADLEKQVTDLGLTERFRFAGFQADPRPFLGLIDVFVLPVPVGSMSIGLLEAMAMQRAVVITFGGKGEAVEHAISGLCAEPRNPDSIAQSVISILSDPARQQAFGEAARQRIKSEFSAEGVARKLEKLYL